jgi:peptide/nickel transport system substrate-binding protein
MHRKSLLSLFMLSMGVALLVAATMVGVASAKSASSGTLIVTQAGTGFDTLDPQLSYVSNDWGLLYNTEITLLNFPTKAGVAGTKLIPQGATAFPTISSGGKVYTFHLRSGLKLSNGAAIGCQNYVRSFERNLSPHMYAAYGTFDQIDQFIKGGSAFANGHASSISGLSCPNNLTLKITLNMVVPQFTTIMGMPWFMAIPTNLPYNNTPGGVKVYASGGPYYISSNNNDTLTVLKRNNHWPTLPYFKSNWPANPLSIVIKSNANSSGTPELLQAEKNQVDIAGVASQDVVAVKNKYGVNKVNGQFHVGPTTCVLWNAMNDQAANNATSTPANRKALNYAISRNVENNFLGPLAGDSTEQILVPAIPGYHKLTYYGGTGNLAAAAAVPGQNLSGKDFNIYYRASSPSQTNIAEYIQSQVNGAPLHMVPHLIPSDPSGYYHPLMTKSIALGAGGYNITASGGWCADYEDGFDYFNVNFDGRTISDTGNTDYEYFNNPTFNSHMDAAAAKTGAARATAYGNLDKEFMQTYAPLIPKIVTSTREFTSTRVHNWIYSTWWGQGFWNAIKLS